MKYLILVMAFASIILTSMMPEKYAGATVIDNGDKKFEKLLGDDASPLITNWVDSLFTKMDLKNKGLNYDVFFKASKGYEYMLSEKLLAKPDVLTIVDYSQKSSKKRLYVIDMKKGILLFNTFVAHGRNSGTDYATNFSNSPESLKSSLGFMITEGTYMGGNGYSLRFKGLEKGINDNVYARAIVMHGSDYVSPERAAAGTMMGRSFGCPAVSAKENKKIVDVIKGGSCFFGYHTDSRYAQSSKILNAQFSWPVAKILNTQVNVQNSLQAKVSPAIELMAAHAL